jgi:branched-chain amino acid transport system substrate-binding protein
MIEHDERESRKGYSRREFLRIAGVAGAAVGAGAGLGGLLAACGGTEETTTTTGAPTTTTAGPATTTTTAGPATTVTTAAEMGREIKIGWVAPLTGSLASFGVPDKYCAERWAEAVADGLVCGDGKNHKISIVTKDSQSDGNRAAQVAGDLINNDKVDIVLVASTPDTVNPVADQCEALGTPCLSNDCPWQPYFFGRGGDPKVGFKWTYHAFWGSEDFITAVNAMFLAVPTNKIVGGLWPNDADGNAFRPAWTEFLAANGYKLIDPGPYQNGMEDFTQQISQFKNAGVELLTGVVIPPDMTNFWKQAAQQGWTPKVCAVGKALLFPQSVEAMGPIGNGLATELWWHKNFPFKSSLTGETCAELAADFEKRAGIQWTPPLLHYITFEMAVDTLKRTTNVDDKEAIMTAVKGMKLDTIGGTIDFTSPVADGSMHPVPNVYKTPLGGAQWLMLGGKWQFEEVIVNNAAAPMITVEQPLKALPLTA